MNIFTESARHQICRTLASMIIEGEVEELDFLSDERIWAECWVLFEVTLKSEERMVPPEHHDDEPLSLAGERIKHAFDIFPNTESLFENDARAQLVQLPHGKAWRYRVNEQNQQLEVRAEGAAQTTWGESTDISLWYSLVSVAEGEIQYSDHGGVWLRNCFAYLRKNGTLPRILLFDEEFE